MSISNLLPKKNNALLACFKMGVYDQRTVIYL